jgi:hypothetical protein
MIAEVRYELTEAIPTSSATQLASHSLAWEPNS